MSALASRVSFHVELAKDYREQIEAAIDDELKIAQRKWGVKLNEAAQELVRGHSLNQLALKVDSTMKTSWNLEEQRVISIKIKGLTRGSGGITAKEIRLPAELRKIKDLKFVLSRDGFEVEPEESDDTVLPADLPDYILQKIMKWVRSAVFYGVGSYKS